MVLESRLERGLEGLLTSALRDGAQRCSVCAWQCQPLLQRAPRAASWEPLRNPQAAALFTENSNVVPLTGRWNCFSSQF